jgi:hypothetical protein
LCPMWDTLHPGRGWAEKCRTRSESTDDLQNRVISFLNAYPPEPNEGMDFDPSSSG